MSTAAEEDPWALAPADEAVMAAFLTSGKSDKDATSQVELLASDTGIADGAVLAATRNAVGDRILHLRHFRLARQQWVNSGGLSIPYPLDIPTFYGDRHAVWSARILESLTMVVSVEDRSDDVCLLAVGQTRRLVGASVVLRMGDGARPLPVGASGLVVVCRRVHRRQNFDALLDFRDASGNVLETLAV